MKEVEKLQERITALQAHYDALLMFVHVGLGAWEHSHPAAYQQWFETTIGRMQSASAMPMPVPSALALEALIKGLLLPPDQAQPDE